MIISNNNHRELVSLTQLVPTARHIRNIITLYNIMFISRGK